MSLKVETLTISKDDLKPFVQACLENQVECLAIDHTSDTVRFKVRFENYAELFYLGQKTATIVQFSPVSNFN